MLKLEGICAGYGKTPVLSDISLDFPAGTVTAILGPNGSGKSTLLKAAAGLLPISGGRVLGDEDRAKSIAYLAQSRSVPEMTAEQLVLHGRFPWLSWPRRYRREDIAIARRAMERLGIADCAGRMLGELSGGTRQKCWLAMALAQEAQTLLLDEPTSYLDIGCQLELMALCRELASEGRAVAVVLHDLPLALGTADRVAVLDRGRLLALDTPDRIHGSGLLDRTFGVRVLKLDTPAGAQYVCVRE